MQEKHWQTEISYTTEDEIRVRGYDLVEMMGEVPFASAVHLMITGELPSPKVEKIIDALMVASIDHGAGTPSVLATRTAASGGASVKNAATAGFLTMDTSHGAAVESCMVVLGRVMKLSVDFSEVSEIEKVTSEFLSHEKEAGRKIIPGFGHRQHHHDPRVDKLFQMALEAGLEGKYITAAQVISKVLSDQAGKELPINIDGAMAAILLELNYPLGLGNAPFLIARLTSLLVHAHEEVTKMPRMRRIDPVDFSYCGVEARDLPIQNSITTKE